MGSVSHVAKRGLRVRFRFRFEGMMLQREIEHRPLF